MELLKQATQDAGASWIVGVILLQTSLIAVLVASVVVLLLVRKGYRAYQEAIQKRHQEWLTAALLCFMDGLPPPPFQLSRWERSLFRDALLGQILALKGQEREYFGNIYKRFSFFDEDVQQLNSIFWEKRLAVIARLDQLAPAGLGNLLLSRLEDEKPLVALAALISVCRTGEKIEPETLFSALERSSTDRKDVLKEILVHLVRTRGPEYVLSYVQNRPDPELMAMTLRTFAKLQATDVGPAVLKILENLSSQSEELLCALIECVQSLYVLDAIPYLTPYLDHTSPKVRARAISALIGLGDTESQERILLMKDDSDIEVRRAVHSMIAARVAA